MDAGVAWLVAVLDQIKTPKLPGTRKPKLSV